MKRNIISLLILLITFNWEPVFSQCLANFTYTQGLNGLITFSNTSTGTNSNTIYQWNFGEPISNFNYSNIENPNHIYGSNGVFSSTLTIMTSSNGGCTSTVAINVSVTSSPCNLPINADFVSVTNLGNTTFTSLSTGTTGGVVYMWDFGDGGTSSAPNPVHTYSASSSYLVKLKLIDGGCTDSSIILTGICIDITIFIANPGPNGLYSFTSTSTNTTGLSGYFWSYGDGTFGNGITSSHQYSINGQRNVQLNLSNTNYSNCPTSTIVSISVNNSTCTIIPSYSYNVNPGGNVTFSSTSTGTTGGTTYTWSFGEGASANGVNSSHTYSNGGLFYTRMIAENSPGCKDSTFQFINVNTIPCVANSNFSLVFSGTPLLWFATPSYPWNINCGTWTWGDGTSTFSSCVVYTTHVYPAAGIYTICFEAVTSCGTSSTCAGYNVFKMPEMPAMVTLNIVPPGQFVSLVKENFINSGRINIIPNPSEGEIFVNVPLFKNSHESILKVTNIIGEVILEEKIQLDFNDEVKKLDLSRLKNGIYILELSIDNRTYNGKVVIRK